MKKSIRLLAMLSLLPLAMSAQDSLSTIQKENLPKKQKCDINYFTMYAGLSTTSGAHIESIFYKNWGVGVSLGTKAFATKNVPQPFSGGLFGDGRAYDFLYSTNITVIKKFPVSPRARFGADLGVSFINYKTPTFKYVQGDSWVASSGYRIKDYNIQNSTGLQARVSFDWLLTPYTGIELSVLGNLNQHQSFLSPNIKFVTGFLRKKIKTVNKPTSETSQNNGKNDRKVNENFAYFDAGIGGAGNEDALHFSVNYRHNGKHLYSIGTSNASSTTLFGGTKYSSTNFWMMYGRAFTHKNLFLSASTGIGMSETVDRKTDSAFNTIQTQANELLIPAHLQVTYLFTQNVGIGAFMMPHIKFKGNSYVALGVNMHFGLLRK